MRDTIDMAREAGAKEYTAEENAYFFVLNKNELELFEALVRADERSVEREACAKWLEDKADAPYLAERIRARGEHMTIVDVIHEHLFDIFVLILLALIFFGDKK